MSRLPIKAMSRLPISRPALFENILTHDAHKDPCVVSPPLLWPPILWHGLNGLGQFTAQFESKARQLLFSMHPVDENNYPPANMILITYILRSELRPSENAPLSSHFMERWKATRESLGLRFQLVPCEMEGIFCCCLENGLHICCLISGTMLNIEHWEKGHKHRRIWLLMIVQDHQAHGVQMC